MLADATVTIMSCRIGRFIFQNNGSLTLSLMKRIRDDVMGQTLAPTPGSKPIRSSEDAYAYVKNELEINVPFELAMNR